MAGVSSPSVDFERKMIAVKRGKWRSDDLPLLFGPINMVIGAIFIKALGKAV
jgi:hypothetical protein